MGSFPNHVRSSGTGCEYISPKAVVVPEAKGSHNSVSRWLGSHWLLRHQVVYHFKMGFLANYQNDVSIKTNQKYRECMLLYGLLETNGIVLSYKSIPLMDLIWERPLIQCYKADFPLNTHILHPRLKYRETHSNS